MNRGCARPASDQVIKLSTMLVGEVTVLSALSLLSPDHEVVIPGLALIAKTVIKKLQRDFFTKQEICLAIQCDAQKFKASTDLDLT